MQHLRNLVKNTFLFVGYTGLALWIGEVHPFTLVPMYNHFPNWAYAYYLTNEKQELILVNEHFDYHAGSLSHLFCGIAQENHIAYGNMRESDDELALIGTQMLKQLKPLVKKEISGKELQLHRKTFFIHQDRISSRDQVLATMPAVNVNP